MVVQVGDALERVAEGQMSDVVQQGRRPCQLIVGVEVRHQSE